MDRRFRKEAAELVPVEQCIGLDQPHGAVEILGPRPETQREPHGEPIPRLFWQPVKSNGSVMRIHWKPPIWRLHEMDPPDSLYLVRHGLHVRPSANVFDDRIRM